MYSNYSKLINYFKKTIIIFSGSDILQLKDSPQRSQLIKMLVVKGVIFTSVGETLQQEVKKLFKIDSEVLYLPTPHKFPLNPPPFLEDSFSVGCYIPSTNYNFYGFPLVRAVAKLDSTIFYNIYSLNGGGRNEFGVPKFGEENLIFYEKPILSTEMPNFISNIKCGLRITEHDGYPMSIAEYMMMGRYFIFNNNMPNCDVLNNPNPENILVALNDIRKRKSLNIEGSKLYRSRHDQNIFKSNLKRLFS
jgi:hypothetical protein